MMTSLTQAMTPKQIVAALDQYIVGQTEAKRAMAIALRNRARRQALDPTIRDEIVPKNLLMIGPTGVGKTEIARRLAKLTQAPFVKVEATKFTEIGYVGRDVESMIRDLVETAIRMVKAEHVVAHERQAQSMATDRLVHLLVPDPEPETTGKNPFDVLFGSAANKTAAADPNLLAQRESVRQQLLDGKLEDQSVEMEVSEQHSQLLDFLFNQSGNDPTSSQLSELAGKMFPKKTKKRLMTVREARPILVQEAAQMLMDNDAIHQRAIDLAEQSGIIFIDEIDKVASSGGGQGPDVSREGVQRDILPIVEGSTVNTKYGVVKTDHMLFIAAGAFHIAKPTDLIPELQGRFPIRVELQALSQQDYEAILRDPHHALTKQAVLMLATEGVHIQFEDAAIVEIAKIAYETNQFSENIGARRLHALLEKVLEEISFEAPELQHTTFTISEAYVRQKLSVAVAQRDLSRYIL